MRVEGADLDVVRARVAPSHPFDVAEADGVVRRVRLLDHGPQLDGPVRELEVLERAPEVALAEAEQRAGLHVRRREVAGRVDDELRDRRRLETRLTDSLGLRKRDNGRALALDHLPQLLLHVLADSAREDPLLQVEGNEEVRSREEGLGSTEEEVARRQQGEVEVQEDPPLDVRVEVHERVTARDEVDTGERRGEERVETV